VDAINQALDRALARRGLALTVEDDQHLLRGPTLKLFVDRATLQRAVLDEGGSPDDAATALLDRLLDRAAGLPDWFVAKSGVRFALVPDSDRLTGHLHMPVSPHAAAVLTYTDPHELMISWLRADVLSRWFTDDETLHRTALQNLDGVLAKTTLEVQDARGFKLGMLSVDSAYKGALLLAPGLRAVVEPEFGWPVCAVVPCRDFVFVFADADREPLIPMLAAAVMTEFESSAHPVTNEVWRITDDGIEAIGAYGDAPS